MKNLIIITIDGARTDFVQKSSIFQELNSKSIFSHNCITYAPHTIASMHAIFSELMVLEMVPIVIGQHINLKKMILKH